MPQLHEKDVALIDKVIRKEKGTPADALRQVNAARRARNLEPAQRDAVYRYIKGQAHSEADKKLEAHHVPFL